MSLCYFHSHYLMHRNTFRRYFSFFQVLVNTWHSRRERKTHDTSRHFYGYQLLIADLINYSYDTEFIQRLLKKNEKKLCTKFGDFGDRIYPVDLEIKDTTYTSRSASYLDLHLEIITPFFREYKNCVFIF
jgi:hypothetical protein